MCSRYEAPSVADLASAFGVTLDEPVQRELWPGYIGPFIRASGLADTSDAAAPALVAGAGVFGLLPFWAKDTKLARRTYNARSETVASKPSYRDAWKLARHCIIPARAIYEPDWRTGKPIPTRIERADGQLLGIAGLWDRWRNPDGREVLSFTMLTVSADDHPLMRNFHRPGDERRMVVILPAGAYGDWLHAPAEQSAEFMRQYPADRLVAEAAG
ncbi:MULTISPECIES: SOS response-associated peptidase [Ectopseudomonas]|uniref:Abasic site processing protein n=2 Tax=Ectopseudomonas TaxID=3236654 RepID=A0A1G6PTJ5_9GAMM|nr:MULTISPECIES: SOS response-associated peptidase [Pseudomonas]ALN21916.1 hypothetical protein DW68_024885 [Pseudomonas mendocina S5.2]KER98030.1 hypothetical protein HN51_24810 [Pseudomonas mendocina]MBP3061924.1 SOS response-associated peptidase [Pseudomonas chengduensis]NNB75216.1 SOS response-associated peptidase [Pseudomonas chengduensis]SDC83453.1 Putative SOS response-associated peptidase YedK [Pseudomonas chengduensis]